MKKKSPTPLEVAQADQIKALHSKCPVEQPVGGPAFTGDLPPGFKDAQDAIERMIHNHYRGIPPADAPTCEDVRAAARMRASNNCKIKIALITGAEILELLSEKVVAQKLSFGPEVCEALIGKCKELKEASSLIP